MVSVGADTFLLAIATFCSLLGSNKLASRLLPPAPPRLEVTALLACEDGEPLVLTVPDAPPDTNLNFSSKEVKSRELSIFSSSIELKMVPET